jgi:hypothetical protein
VMQGDRQGGKAAEGFEAGKAVRGIGRVLHVCLSVW